MCAKMKPGKKSLTGFEAKIPYVAEGFRKDCFRLLQNYEKLETLRYEHFCQVWKEMNFTLIYSGRTLIAELTEFTEEAFIIAKDILINTKNEFNRRVGALYLLYGIYGRQPLRGTTKIRITLNEYKIYLNLMNELRNGKHLDALYICCKLNVMRAFIFVATTHTYALHRSFRKYHDKYGNLFETDDDETQQKIERLSTKSGFYEALEKLNHEYYKAKCVLPGAKNFEPEEALNLVDTKLVNKLQINYQNLLTGSRSENENKPSCSTGVPVEHDIVNNSNNLRSIREKRQELRKKAFEARIIKRREKIQAAIKKVNSKKLKYTIGKKNQQIGNIKSRLEEKNKRYMIAKEKFKRNRIFKDRNKQNSVTNDKNEKNFVSKNENEQNCVSKNGNEQNSVSKNENEQKSVLRDENEKISIVKDKIELNSVSKDQNERNFISKDENDRNSVSKDENDRNSISKDKNKQNSVSNDQNERNSVSNDENKQNSVLKNKENPVSKQKNKRDLVSQDKNERNSISKDKRQQNFVSKEKDTRNIVPQDKKSQNSVSKDKSEQSFVSKEKNNKVSFQSKKSKQNIISTEEDKK